MLSPSYFIVSAKLTLQVKWVPFKSHRYEIFNVYFTVLFKNVKFYSGHSQKHVPCLLIFPLNWMVL